MILIFHSDSCNTNLHLVSLSVLFLELTLLLFLPPILFFPCCGVSEPQTVYIHSTTTGIPGSTSGAQSQSQSSLYSSIFYPLQVSVYPNILWVNALRFSTTQSVVCSYQSMQLCHRVHEFSFVKSTRRISVYYNPILCDATSHIKQESSMWQKLSSLTN